MDDAVAVAVRHAAAEAAVAVAFLREVVAVVAVAERKSEPL